MPQLPPLTHRKCHLSWASTTLFQTLTMGEAALRLLLYKTKQFTDFFFPQYLLVVNRRVKLVHFTNPASPCPAVQSSPPWYLRMPGGTVEAAELLCHAHGVQTLLAIPFLVSLPLVIQAGAEVFVLITVGNTNQKGTFFYSCLPLFFLSECFLPAYRSCLPLSMLLGVAAPLL